MLKICSANCSSTWKNTDKSLALPALTSLWIISRVSVINKILQLKWNETSVPVGWHGYIIGWSGISSIRLFSQSIIYQVCFSCQTNIDPVVYDFKDLCLSTSQTEITTHVFQFFSFLSWTKKRCLNSLVSPLILVP